MRVALFGALSLHLAACSSDEKVNPVSPGRQSTAQTLGMFSTELPDDFRDQALLTLEQDAYRREHRFLDAAKSGHLFRSTQVFQSEVESGAWSSDELFQLGAQLFHVTFTRDVGFGAADLPPLSRFHNGRRGGPETRRCASCHWRGGPAGAGDGADNAYLDGDGDSQASALARNPIALAGAGLVQILANEMNEDLANLRGSALKQASDAGSPRRVELLTKGVSFGFLTARPDGSLDTVEVVGVDPDLLIKPFGWKGNLATLRDAVEDALLVHHGMQSDTLTQTATPDRIGGFGLPDPDGDGKVNEISEGQVSVLTLYLAMQEVPQIVPPDDSNFALYWAEGRAQFQSLGCASCHVPSLPLRSTKFVITSRTGGPPVEIDLAQQGAQPRLQKSVETGTYDVYLFSDLKRHVMGPRLSEPRFDRTVPGSHFLTRPLWGVARSRPYLHDGHAPTLQDAILQHDGEAQQARDAYAIMPDLEQAKLRIFLTSLTRARRMISP